jgi:hypothetical protein
MSSRHTVQKTVTAAQESCEPGLLKVTKETRLMNFQYSVVTKYMYYYPHIEGASILPNVQVGKLAMFNITRQMLIISEISEISTAQRNPG